MEKFTTSFEINIPDDVLDAAQEKNDRVSEKNHKKKTAVSGFYLANAILVFLILITLFVVFSVAVCTLKEIEYEGVTNTDTNKLKSEVLNVKYPTNTMYIFLRSKFRDFSEVEFVENGKVKLKSPHIISVEVSESELYGYVPFKNKCVYFDSKGKICEISSRSIENVTVVSGFDLKKAEIGESLPIKESDKKALINVLKFLHDNELYAESVVFDSDGTFGFLSDNIFVNLGMSSDIKEKCDRLTYIMPQIAGQSGVLHLEEWSRDNTDIIFEKTN